MHLPRVAKQINEEKTFGKTHEQVIALLSESNTIRLVLQHPIGPRDGTTDSAGTDGAAASQQPACTVEVVKVPGYQNGREVTFAGYDGSQQLGMTLAEPHEGGRLVVSEINPAGLVVSCSAVSAGDILLKVCFLFEPWLSTQRHKQDMQLVTHTHARTHARTHTCKHMRELFLALHVQLNGVKMQSTADITKGIAATKHGNLVMIVVQDEKAAYPVRALVLA